MRLLAQSGGSCLLVQVNTIQKKQAAPTPILPSLPHWNEVVRKRKYAQASWYVRERECDGARVRPALDARAVEHRVGLTITAEPQRGNALRACDAHRTNFIVVRLHGRSSTSYLLPSCSTTRTVV